MAMVTTYSISREKVLKRQSNKGFKWGRERERERERERRRRRRKRYLKTKGNNSRKKKFFSFYIGKL